MPHSFFPVTLPEFENLLLSAGFLPSTKPLKIAVAVSGGADSLALTLLLNDWCLNHQASLLALTVDHGLRQESTSEAQRVNMLLTNQGITHHILTWDGRKPQGGLQEKARAKRYDLLESWCSQNTTPFLFLGHHQGDQSETYCMRLRQQSGLLGLASMRAISKRQRVTLVRPLLGIPKERLMQTMMTRNLSWIQDPSNHNPAFERIFWRHTLEGKTPPLRAFQKVRTAFDGWIQRYLNKHAHLSPLGYATVPVQAFLSLPPTFQEILFSHLVRSFGTGKYTLSSKALEACVQKLHAYPFQSFTVRGLKISKGQGIFSWIREHRAITHVHDLLHAQSPFLWDGRFMIDPRYLPQQKTGARIKALGEKGWQALLQKEPSLKDLPHPRAALWSLPALYHSDEIDLENWLLQDILSEKSIFFRSKSPF